MPAPVVYYLAIYQLILKPINVTSLYIQSNILYFFDPVRSMHLTQS